MDTVTPVASTGKNEYLGPLPFQRLAGKSTCLNDNEKAMVTALTHHVDNTTGTYEGGTAIETLAKFTGFSYQRAHKSLWGLSDKGWVTIIPRVIEDQVENDTSLYQLHEPPKHVETCIFCTKEDLARLNRVDAGKRSRVTAIARKNAPPVSIVPVVIDPVKQGRGVGGGIRVFTSTLRPPLPAESMQRSLERGVSPDDRKTLRMDQKQDMDAWEQARIAERAQWEASLVNSDSPPAKINESVATMLNRSEADHARVQLFSWNGSKPPARAWCKQLSIRSGVAEDDSMTIYRQYEEAVVEWRERRRN